MKVLKYRSALAGVCVAALSVFLFTACEKESDATGIDEPVSKFEKFKRLTFSSGSTSTSTSSTSSGTFSGGGGSISFSGNGDGDNQFADAEASGPDFTDPQSTDIEFAVNEGLPNLTGGGSISIDGEDYDVLFGFCANSDITSQWSLRDTNNVQVFVGIVGDKDKLSLDNIGNALSDPNNSPIEFFIYAFSYNGGSNIGGFELFENSDAGDIGTAAFVMAVSFGKDENGDPMTYSWFGTSGNVNFSGNQVLMSGVELSMLEQGKLSNEKVDVEANIECVQAEE